MAHGSNYRVKFRRRREGKTNYYKRYRMVLSRVVRVVVRRTNKYIMGSIVQFDPKGDRVLAGAHSKELEKLGWKGGTKNLGASYLTGYLLGKKALKAGIKSAVVDLGLFNPHKGGRLYAFIQGVIDSGLEVPVSDLEVDMERVKGKPLAEWAKELSTSDPERYQRLFSAYIKAGLKPEEIVSHFEKVLEEVKKV